MYKIYGAIEKIVYRNFSTGYILYGVRPYNYDFEVDKNGLLYCGGVVLNYELFTPVSICSKEIVSDTYHEIIYSIETIQEYGQKKEEIIRFLLKIDKLGSKKAQRIVSAFSDDFFSAIKETTAFAKLTKECRLNDELAKKIIEHCTKSSDIYALFQFLQKFGCDYNIADKVYRYYGKESEKMLKANPYAVLSPIEVPFIVQDNIAYQQKMKCKDPKRINAILNEIVFRNESNGNTYFVLDAEWLTKQIDMLCRNSLFDGKPDYMDLFPEIKKNYILEEGNYTRIYRKDTYEDEMELAGLLQQFALKKRTFYKVDDSKIFEIEKALGISYDDNQKKAFHLLENTGLSILTGGPGTGKTTVLKGIIDYFTAYVSTSIVACAPTARAASHIKETTGLQAKTIHKLLNIKPFHKNGLVTDTEINADLLIVDEVSMLDNELASILLKACKNVKIILFVGDSDQLPSINVGDVLNQLILSGRYPIVQLLENHRQNGLEAITDNARSALIGYPELDQTDNFSVYQINENNFTDILLQIYEKEAMVLSASKKGYMGTVKCNQIIQENVLCNKEECIEIGPYQYHIGDRIMFLRNVYNVDTPYFNGDMGTIVGFDEHDIYIKTEEEIVKLSSDAFFDITLAYAITIHKSQGSESPYVIVVLSKQYAFMLTPKLLYTAFTRAKEKVVLLVEKDAYNIAINNIVKESRNSVLGERLKGKTYSLLS